MKTIHLDLILSNAIGVSVDYLLFKNEVQIVRPDEAFEAMREACNQAIELAASTKHNIYDENGNAYISRDSILKIKSQII